MIAWIMENRRLVAQIIGFMGTFIMIIGMQQKTYDRIVLSKILNSFFSSIHYFFLGGYTGMLINFASCFANGVYWYRNKRNKGNLVFQIIFCALFVGLGLMSWHGWISIFVIIAKVLSSVALGINNPRTIRILNLISNPSWLVYNIFMGSYPGMVGDSLITLSVLIAIIRYDILKREEKARG